MKTYNRVCRCGVAFEAQDHRVKNCPACREAKAAAEAARPFKTCAKCGKQEQIRRGHSWCMACREELEAARIQQVRADVIERRRREMRERLAKQEEAKQEEESSTPTRERIAEAIASLPYDSLVQVIAVLLAPRLGSTVTENVANPEEEAHANQDDIDAAFNDMMKGLEL